VGYAHSWAGIYKPQKGSDGKHGMTISLQNLQGITSLSPLGSEGRGEVEVLAGTSFAYLHEELDKKGLALAWLVRRKRRHTNIVHHTSGVGLIHMRIACNCNLYRGLVDRALYDRLLTYYGVFALIGFHMQSGGIQGLTVGGAVSVGFHGSHLNLGSVSTLVSHMTIYDTQGHRHELTVSEPDITYKQVLHDDTFTQTQSCEKNAFDAGRYQLSHHYILSPSS